MTATDRVEQNLGTPRPKLLFFQFRYDENTPQFLLEHKNEHVRCLSQFFDISVVESDCDFDEMCTRHEPDLVLFESGVEAQTAHRLQISNIATNRSIPRLALANADGCTELRAGILSDLEHWEIEAVFTISAVAAEHLPSIPTPLYTWPNFIDPAVHHDRALPKLIPFLISGSQSPRYPWRHDVFRLLSTNYPCIMCPHGGYNSRQSTSKMLVGKSYSKALNATVFAPACGSVTKDVVRKHLEIPANRSCLITEDSPALRAAGFEDMVNCVMADPRDVLDKVEYLLRNPERLEEITVSGYDLVQARHTLRQRDQIFEWFRLRMNHGRREQIIQRSCFGEMEAAESNLDGIPPLLNSHGRHLELLRRADTLLASRQFPQAVILYREILSLLSEFPEAKLKIGICHLYMGTPRLALRWIIQPLRCSLKRYGAEDPDPVEWSYLILSLLCLGRVGSAFIRAAQFRNLRHPELDRARRLIARITGSNSAPIQQCDGELRPSFHRMPICSDEKWTAEVASILRACGQERLAVLTADVEHQDRATLSMRWRGSRRPWKPSKVRLFHILSRTLRPTLSGLDHPELISRSATKLKEGGGLLLDRLLAKWRRLPPSVVMSSMQPSPGGSTEAGPQPRG